MERAEFMARAIIALGTAEQQRGGTRFLTPPEIIERVNTLWITYLQATEPPVPSLPRRPR